LGLWGVEERQAAERPRRRYVSGDNQVVNGWWLAGEAVGMLFLVIPSWRIAYRYGIRDGAFNQHLPVVRREMVLYDERRAKAIFEAEDDSVRDVSGNAGH
jgi:hypothetical protein